MKDTIDWSKAPEGATHYLPGDEHYFACWVKPGYTMKAGMQSEWVSDELESVVHLLIARPAPWDGTGLPPAGTVCEVMHDARWYETAIIGVDPDDGSVVFRTHADYECPYDGYTTAGNFRPIRTPEQIAAEERLHSVRNACSAIADTLDGLRGKTKVERAALAVVEAMIDAGYRKVAP